MSRIRNHITSRLDLQHFLVKERVGHLIHPNIPLPTEDCRVADVACGSCIWPIEVSEDLLPKDARVDCFDISDSQFPHSDLLPANVHTHIHDAFNPFPREYHGQFDLVNVRFLCCATGSVRILVENLVKLLRRDGYLQWIEADLTDIRLLRPRSAPCPTAEGVHALMTAPIPGLSFKWVSELGESTFPSVGLFDAKSTTFEIDMSYESFYCLLKLLIYAFEKGDSKPSKSKLAMLEDAYTEMRLEEAGVDWDLVEVIGRKGGDGKWVPSWGKWVETWS